MLPPSLRDDLLQAASVAVVDTIHRRVLLGRRRTPPWLGYWVFPGGGVEAGESPWHAARRELLEETGLELSGVPFSQDSVAVGSGDRAWRIHHFRAATLRTGSVRATDELEPRWVEWEDLELLKPMASSTRRMLEGLRTLMVRW
jgi:8-oxo-dGTP diphosphatase